MKKNKIWNSKEEVVVKNHYSITVTIDSSTVSANSDGRKIVKAGTLLGHATKKLWEDRSVKASVINGANSQVVVMHEVDVTDGDLETGVLVEGVVIKNKVTDAVTAIHADVNLGDRILLSDYE